MAESELRSFGRLALKKSRATHRFVVEFFNVIACATVTVQTYPPHSKGPGPRRTPSKECIAYFCVAPVHISVIHMIKFT